MIEKRGKDGGASRKSLNLNLFPKISYLPVLLLPNLYEILKLRGNQHTSNTRTSITLVFVGPVLIRSSSFSKK